MWEKVKELYASVFLIITAGWLLTHLMLIELYGVVQITEGNMWILWAEIILVGAILILAVERFIKDFRNMGRH